jgi:hypothetical protein
MAESASVTRRATPSLTDYTWSISDLGCALEDLPADCKKERALINRAKQSLERREKSSLMRTDAVPKTARASLRR